MSIAPHTELFTVRGYEVGIDNLLTVQSLCNYYQEAAGIHAANLGLSIEKLHTQGLTWVLFRMQLVFGAMPLAMERISVETWPVGVDGLQYRRDFLALDERGGFVGKAVSQWVVVNLQSRRVGRVPQFISAIRLDYPRMVMQDAGGTLQGLGGDDEACRFRARLGDMDRNRHVNSVRYLDWILESVPASVRDERTLSFLDIAYKAESRQGDLVSARIRSLDAGDGTEAGDSVAFAHGLVRPGDDKELVRARSVWSRTAQSAQ